MTMKPKKGRKVTDVDERLNRRAARIESWSEVPVGTLVEVMRDDGSLEQRKTRSKPWMLCGTPVIQLEGISGGYALCRCTVLSMPPDANGDFVEPKQEEDGVLCGPIHFECPACKATHDRGFVDGESIFRCLHCGYSGHGFHKDPEIDKAVYAEHVANNKINRDRGIPEVPLGIDPLNGPG